jgi:hypothetical protein
MNHTSMDSHLARLRVFMAAALLAVAPACALADDEIAGAQAAGLEIQAGELEAKIAKECLKVAVPARPLCHKQMGQAVARLREQAQRAD